MTRRTRVYSPPTAVLCLASLAALLAPTRAQVVGPLNYLVPMPINLGADGAMHIANRVTFGQTEALVTSLTGPSSAAMAWIDSQLAPNFATENPDVAALLTLIDTPVAPVVVGGNHKFEQIRDGVHVYSSISDWQLAARMGYFWDRHFNTFGPFVNAFILGGGLGSSFTAAESENVTSRLEWLDYEFYRQNGLGTFRDLALHTFKSPAMMIYLDTFINACNSGEPNENMAREFMELHTIGPIYAPTGLANYNVSDIDTVAQIMAGWRLTGTGYAGAELAASFVPSLHCTFSATIFGTPALASLAVTGTTTGVGGTTIDDLVNHLVASEACKDFICRKLMTEFIGDGSADQYPLLLNAMKNQWGTQGNLSAVIGRMLKSGELFSGPTKWQRAKTPFESAISSMRIWNGSFRKPSTGVLEKNRVAFLRGHSEAIGETLFGFQTPDGFDLESNHQPGSGVTLMTFRMFSDEYYSKSLNLAGQPPYEARGGVVFPLSAWVTASLGAPGNQNPVTIATLFLNRAYGSKWTATDLQAVSTALNVDVTGAIAPLNPANLNSYTERLGQGVMATMSMNQGLLR